MKSVLKDGGLSAIPSQLKPLIEGDELSINPHSRKTNAEDNESSNSQIIDAVSEQLSVSYQSLENHVGELKKKLSQAKQDQAKELKENELLSQRINSILDILPSGLLVIDKHGVIQQANPAAEILLSIDPNSTAVDTVVGKAWIEIISCCFSPQKDDGHELSLKNGRRINLATSSLKNEPGQIVLMTDLTETRKLQEMLGHQQRLSEMGKMMASLAHQIRTPLSSAMIYSAHLIDEELPENKRSDFSVKLRSCLKRVEGQLKGMLLFSKNQLQLDDTVRLDRFLEKLEIMIRPISQNNRSEITFTLHDQNRMMLCNEEVLLSAVNNIVVNALEACDETQFLETDDSKPSSRKVDVIFSIQPGITYNGDSMIRDGGAQVKETLCIAVSDNGPGIPSHIIQRIFEPFFTSKKTGTGLGMSVVDIVAKAHGGTVVAENKLQCSGAKVTLQLDCLLPAIDEVSRNKLCNVSEKALHEKLNQLLLNINQKEGRV